MPADSPGRRMIGSKGVADFPLSKSGVAGSLGSSTGTFTQPALAQIAGGGGAAICGHHLKAVFHGKEGLDGNDDPGPAGVDDCLGTFEGCVGTLQGSLGSGDAEFGLPLDVLQDPQRKQDADIAKDDENQKSSPEHLIVPGPRSRLRRRWSDYNLLRLGGRR